LNKEPFCMQDLVEQFPIEIRLMIRRELFELDRELLEQKLTPFHDLSDDSKQIHALSRYLYKIKSQDPSPRWYVRGNEDKLDCLRCDHCQECLQQHFSSFFGIRYCDKYTYRYCQKCGYVDRYIFQDRTFI